MVLALSGGLDGAIMLAGVAKESGRDDRPVWKVDVNVISKNMEKNYKKLFN